MPYLTRMIAAGVCLIVTVALQAAADDSLVVVHAGNLWSWRVPPRETSGNLLVSPGGTLNASAEARRTNGAFAVECLTAQGYQAVNLIPGDFARGLAAVQPLLKQGLFVSANLRDHGGARIAAPFVIVNVGGRRIGITGVSLPPAPDDPSAKAFAADLTATDPIGSLKDVAPDLARQSDVRVLLFYGNAISAAATLRTYPQFQLCLNCGGVAQPGVAHVGTAVLVQSPSGGNSFAVTTLPGGAAAAARSDVRPAALMISDTLQNIYLRNHLTSNPVDAATTQPATTAGPSPAQPIAQRLPDNGILALNCSASNRAVRVTASICRVTAQYGDATPAQNAPRLVISTTWENIIPLTLIAERQIPTEYLVPDLADHLYAVVNGSIVIRLSPNSGELPGAIVSQPFKIEKLGEVVRGNLVFDLPLTPIRSLELRYYDFAQGNFVLPVIASGERVATPIIPLQKNSIIEAGVFAAGPLQTFAGKPAPKGMRYVQVDLRGRSALTTEADATAFDPKAKAGDKLQIGNLLDWKESRKYVQLIVDGEYSYVPLPQSDLPEEPRFLPDIMTGGSLTFLIPDKHQSLELRCDFPNASLPDGTVQQPAALTFAIEGTRPALPSRPAIATAKDDVFDVAIVGQQSSSEFAGVKADDGQQFLILDITVRSIGKTQEFFQPRRQLKYTSESGEQTEADDATLQGPRAPSELIYIPAGDRRTFQMAYRIGTDQSRPRLAYAAVTEGASKVLTLKPLTRAVTQAPDKMDTQQPPAQPAPQAADDHTPPGPRPHGPPQGLAGVGLTPQQVNEAIDRGARGLWAYCQKKSETDGREFGEEEPDILCALALVHSDAHRKIPQFDAALRTFLATVEPHKLQSRASYRNGLLCMLIQAYGDPTYEPKLREAARWLLEAEGNDGTWTYDAEIPEAIFIQNARTGALHLVGGQPPGQSTQDAWKHLTPWKEVNGDNSCTQFAILGLQAAAASGIQLPPEVWQKALDSAKKRHCEDGGWEYNGPSGNSYGSMTSAGICATAITRYRLGQKKNFADDPAINQGLGWLDRNFIVGKHPKYSNENDYVYYYTYSLERVGRILDTEFIGAHEWYPEGARWLINGQHADGLWLGEDGDEKDDPRIASSFALLFLTRATPPLEPIVRKGPGTLRTDVIAPNNRFYVILDCSGSMIDMMDGQLKFDIARNAVRTLIDKLPPNSELALRVYGHRKTSLDPESDLDTELKIPMGPLDKAKVEQTLVGLRARGKTPLALSIEDAISDLGTVSDDKPVTLVLLTDGGEDTTNPRGNPLNAAEHLGTLKNIRFHIVGFDINQQDWSQQLQAMAQRAHGKYWPAARSADLQRSIVNGVLGVPETFAVLDANGKEVEQGRFGETKQLPEGKYTFHTDYAGSTFNQEFYISSGEQTAATFDATQVVPSNVSSTTPPDSAGTTKPWPKFCAHCGAPLQPGQKFCAKCGQKVEPP